ncbi:tetratricopeptide repeat protein [Candidatus Latescibacterota bacterium]
MKTCRVAVAALAVLGLAACAPNLHRQGQQLMRTGHYSQAAERLTAALERNPDGAGILIDLAEALYHQGELDLAEQRLAQARAMAPENGEVSLILGLIHEKRGDRVGAIVEYRTYSQLSRISRTRKLIKARLDRLIREQIGEETQRALGREEQLTVADVPDSTVAVAPFRNLGQNRDLDPLQKGLAEMMVTDLSKVPGLRVLERLRMQEMMREIGLGMTGAVDTSTAPRLGKLLGASQIVAGSFTDLAEEQLRLDVSLAVVKTGELQAGEATGDLARLFRLQKDLTLSLIAAMGLGLTDAQRDAIQELPTESMLAFIAYSRGLDLEDQGEPQAAAAAFQEAVELDPGFEVAEEAAERVEMASTAASEVSVVEQEVLEQPEVETAESVTEEEDAGETATASETGTETGTETEIGSQDVIDRLATTGQYAGAGFIPTGEEGQADVREPLEEQEQEVDFGEGETQLEVIVPLPQPGMIEATGTFEEE